MIQTAGASSWTGTPGDWSSDGNPGWNGTGVPNAPGAVAEYLGGSTVNVTLNMTGTVGTIRNGGTGNASFNLTISNPLTLNQDGAGSSSAVIENVKTAAGGHVLLLSGGTITLADNLIIRNTGGSTRSDGAIQISSNITGSGNITFDNVSNNPTSGVIYLSGAVTSDFTGNVLVRRGAVKFADKDHFGNKITNVITLGEASQGSVTLVSTAAVGSIVNNITVAASTSGTSVLGSISTAGTGNTTYSGTVLLNGSLSLVSSNTNTAFVALTNTVSGTGSLTKIGTGIARLSGTNTYTGDTIVSEGTLLLREGGEQRFIIEDGNVSNRILGTGIIDLNGMFRLDISSLTATSGIWNLVSVGTLSETFGSSFGVAFAGGLAWADDGFGKFTSGDWTFEQGSGNLTLIPEPSATLGLLGMGGILIVILICRRRGIVSRQAIGMRTEYSALANVS